LRLGCPEKYFTQRQEKLRDRALKELAVTTPIIDPMLDDFNL